MFWFYTVVSSILVDSSESGEVAVVVMGMGMQVSDGEIRKSDGNSRETEKQIPVTLHEQNWRS